MPRSTEQILHPERYERKDTPVTLVFPEPGGIFEDVLGENEIRVLIATLAGSDEVQTVMPIGWGGDRFRVYDTGAGPGIVWYAVWDDDRSRDRFLRGSGGALSRTARAGYRAALDTLRVGAAPATRYVLAPAAWNRWSSLPVIELGRGD